MRLPGLDRLLFFVIRKLMRLWVRPQVLPADLAPLGIDPARPVCYVLQNRLLSNVLALETEAIRLGLPRPLRPLRSGGRTCRHRGRRTWPCRSSPARTAGSRPWRRAAIA